MVRRRMIKQSKRPLKVRRRRRGGRNSRRRSGRGMHYVETIPVSIKLGESSKLTYKMLENRPKSMNFRVQYVHFVGQTAFDPTNNTFAPSCIQIQILNSVSSGEIVATSGPVTLGYQPRNVKVHQPRQSDWLPYNQVESEVFAEVQAACIGKALNPAYVRGVVHVLVRFGPEMVTTGCVNLQDFVDQHLISSSSCCDLDASDEIAYLEARINSLKSQLSP